MAIEPTAGPSPQLIFDTITAYQRTEALRAAIELDCSLTSARGGTLRMRSPRRAGRRRAASASFRII